MKKFSKVIALFVVMGLSVSTVFASSFSDVSKEHWAHAAIETVQKRGIMVSSSDGAFRPNENVDYFSFMEILAKAAGYKNPDANPTMDKALREAILKNQEKQMPIIEEYMNKFDSWNRLANKEIAYLLGRGYIQASDMAKFIDINNQRSFLTKQDLATYIVRLIQKEETASREYEKNKDTGFKDEFLMSEANRPNIAYLKNIGFVQGNAASSFGANAIVTRAVSAKMIADAIDHLEKEEPVIYELSRVVSKGDGSFYVLLRNEDKTSFFTMKETVLVEVATGATKKIEAIEIGSKVVVKLEMIDKTEHIMSMRVVGEQQVEDKEDVKDKEDVEREEILLGTIERIGNNKDLSITDKSGNFKTYMLDKEVDVYHNKTKLSFADLNVGDAVTLSVKDGVITKINVESEAILKGHKGEVVSKVLMMNGLKVTLKSQENQETFFVPSDVEMKRNGKKASFAELRMGDEVVLEAEKDKIVGISAQSKASKVEGRIKSILVAAQPVITVETKDGEETFFVVADTEFYDNAKRKNVSLRDINLGQSVEIMLESKEILSVILKEGSSKINYKGIIYDVGEGSRYIDVVVDYDPLTKETMVFKRVNLPLTTKIVENGKGEHRSVLKKGMEILISFSGIEDSSPENIIILN